jgi:hypothetical protein
MHAAFCWSLNTLYHAAPNIYWYDLILWATIFSSCIILVNLSVKREPRQKIFWSIIFSLFFLLPSLVKLQFSISAVLAAGTGALLLQSAIMERKGANRIHTKQLYTAIILIILGCLIRFEAAVLIISFAALVILPVNLLSASKLPLWQSIHYFRDNLTIAPRTNWASSVIFVIKLYSKANTKKFITYVIMIAAVCAIMAIANPPFISESIEQFWVANIHRAYIGEYNADLPDNVTKQIMTETGWTTNDFVLLKSWMFIDPERFSNEKLNVAYHLINTWRKENTIDIFQQHWKRSLLSILRNRLILYYTLLIGLLGLAFFNWKNIFVLSSLLFGCMIILFLLNIYLKIVPYRIYWGLLTISGFASLWLINTEPRLWNRWYLLKLIPISCMLITLQHTFVVYTESLNHQHIYQQTTSDISKLMDSIANTENTLVVIQGASFPYQYYYRPFSQPPNSAFAFIPTIKSGVYNIAPISRDYLTYLGGPTNNSLLCNKNKNVLLISREAVLKHIAIELQEHFQIIADFITVFDGDTFDVFKCNVLAIDNSS